MTINIKTISPTEFIGNSLSSININFENLETATLNLIASGGNFFTPMLNFYSVYKDNLTSMVSLVRSNSAKWESLKSTVNSNSARWLKPIVYISPTIEKFPLDRSIDLIIEEFNSLYPVTLSGAPQYVENQTAIIYYYQQASNDPIIEDRVVYSNPAVCVSEGYKQFEYSCWNKNEVAKLKCYSKRKTMSCKPCAAVCKRKVGLSCVYNETGSGKTTRYTRAVIKGMFNDLYERDLKAVVYKIKDCRWIFERNL